MHLNIVFPIDISYGSSGGPGYKTTVIKLTSGYEQRNINWDSPLRSYDVAYGVREERHLEKIIHFFHIAKGQSHSFLYFDWHDYKTCPINEEPSPTNQAIGVGDGVKTEFQLYKTYNYETYSQTYKIRTPDVDSFTVAIDGNEQTSGFTLNNGIITFTTPPANNTQITWGGKFYIPVRFASDELETQIVAYNAGSARVPLVEVRGI